jgi:hypothetical protein
MTNRILVPVDGSEPSDDALEFALDRFPEATVTVVYVVDPMVDYSRRRAYPGYTGLGEFTTEREKGEAGPSDRRVRRGERGRRDRPRQSRPRSGGTGPAGKHRGDGGSTSALSRNGRSMSRRDDRSLPF